MTSLVPLSKQQWSALLDAAGASPTRCRFLVRPVGIPVHTDVLARALCADGLGSLVVYRGGHLDYGSHWTERPCTCTNGKTRPPRINCPHCRGEGTVRK
ncbi:hypothetical protein ACFP9V_19285 [Deinococcus radiopugnans]|uniref:Uncharacterized protein n=1 Tax=Deinococcus radiopugnans ATCC 19172 TaxID=585398 RepID=A0ABR6NRU7_9DEIO|nr:hypothetical protein [Deinococcus radiopugnans ATCC 19172]